MIGKRKVELLAPAGNIIGFYGAIHAGADAVYLGGSRFGARAYANSITKTELIRCIRYVHLLGRKIYLTVNTLLKEKDLGELYHYLAPFYEAGLDAVIVQDTGVLGFIRKHFPALELHASTQMSLCSHHGAEFLKELGVSRIIPARELSLQEISEIRSRVPVELETFIHGSMCYCYSGQCLFSSILGCRSGNRGRCAQPCRLPYHVRTGDSKSEICYPLSLKDMCTIEHIPRLIEAGIDSFKIEGRMKSPEYAAGVTAVYRKYIDRYYELGEQFGKERAAELYEVSQEDLDDLSALYIRSEKQDGYYFKRNGGDMVTLSNPGYCGNDEATAARIRERYLETSLKLPVKITASFVPGLPAEVTLQADELSVTVQGTPVERAQQQPITEKNVRKQLGKLGDSAFFPEHMELHVEEDAFYPLKQINELRREAVFQLEQSILEKRGCGRRDPGQQTPEEEAGECSCDEKHQEKTESCNNEPSANGIAVSVRTFEQLQGVTDYLSDREVKHFKRLYIDGDLMLERTQEALSLCGKLQKDVEIYISLPYILRQDEDNYLEAVSELMDRYPVLHGMLVRSLDGLAYARKKGYRNRLDTGVYCWNSMTVKELQAMTDGFCLPLELNAGEQRKLLTACGRFEKLVYGRIPMMITANCLLKTTEGCQPDDDRSSILTDRYQIGFPVIRICRHCMNIIYNSVPLSLHKNLETWQKRTDIRLDFTIETGEETAGILKYFIERGRVPFDKYTTGHERRDVI